MSRLVADRSCHKGKYCFMSTWHCLSRAGGFCKPGGDGSISWQQVVGLQRLRIHPTMFCNAYVSQLRTDQTTAIGEDQYRPPVIAMKNHFKYPFDNDIGIKLFTQFPDKGLFGALTGINLATGKFPESRMTHAFGTSCDQDLAVFDDDGCCNEEGIHGIVVTSPT